MGKKEKVTLLVDEAVARELRRAVELGAARSQGALVQEAVVSYLSKLEHAAIRAAYAEASRDPQFLEDVESVTRDFRHADADPEIDIPS